MSVQSNNERLDILIELYHDLIVSKMEELYVKTKAAETAKTIQEIRWIILSDIMIMRFSFDYVALTHMNTIIGRNKTCSAAFKLAFLIMDVLSTFSEEEQFIAYVRALKIMFCQDMTEDDLMHKFRRYIVRIFKNVNNIEFAKEYDELFESMYDNFLARCDDLNIRTKYENEIDPLSKMLRCMHIW